MQKIEVVVDGIIYQHQTHGGISRIYSESLPRMCAMDDALQITILTTDRLRCPLPRHPHIHHLSLFPIEFFLRPRHAWRRVTLQARAQLQNLAIGNGRGHIWHSTYYTRPKHWEGPEVVTVADMIHERHPEFFSRPYDTGKQKRDCVLSADVILCISTVTQQDLCDFYGLEIAKTRVVPLACSSIFRKLNDDQLCDTSPTQKPFLLYVGGRRHYKNFDVLLRSYSAWKQHKDIDLVVVSTAWTEMEKSALTELNVADDVHLLTCISDEKLVQLYNRAVAFIYPSLYEGFGIPLLEAMACGCPIVASRIPSTLEVAGEIPLYFEATETESLLEALEAVCVEGRDSRRVQLGFQHAKQYSWDKTARQTLEVYHTLSHLN